MTDREYSGLTNPSLDLQRSSRPLGSEGLNRVIPYTCSVCGLEDDDLRFGVCFDCATDGDIRLAKKSILQHWMLGITSLFQGVWWRARMDFKIGWERIWRTGEYAPGREWQDY